MSLKTENSRRVAKSRPVCMGLKSNIWKRVLNLQDSKLKLILNLLYIPKYKNI
jgi:hypothetical protein